MSISVSARESATTSGGHDGDAASAASFKATVNSGTQAPLTVQGNNIDTGRYVISGSTNYTRPTDGGGANDGMIKIYDKTNGSFVDVYGDPHLYTSNGDRANFKSDGLTIDLADGTQVQFKPTAVTNGVSYVDAIAVSKGGQTVTQSGYTGSGGVTTSAVMQGGPSTAQGFNDTSDTVLKVGAEGSLGTLVNSFGMQLASTNHEDSLDGMGGGVREFANLSGIKDVDTYSKALAENAGSSNGPNAADEAKATAPTSTGKGADSDLVGLLQQLVTLLGGGKTGTDQPGAPADKPVPQDSRAADPAPETPATVSNTTTKPSTDQVSNLLQQVMALLQQQLSSGTATPQEQALIGQLLPLLQQKLDGAQAQSAGGDDKEAAVLKQLIGTLQPQGTTQGQGTGTTDSAVVAEKAAVTTPSKSYDPSFGISGDEIKAMLAAANGTGPAVNYADYHAPANAQA